MSDTHLSWLPLYGLSLGLPAEVGDHLFEFARSVPANSVAAAPPVLFRSGTVEVSGTAHWESGDATEIALHRTPAAAIVSFGLHRLRIDSAGVVFDTQALGPTLDLNYNPLAAFLLPFHGRIALHAFVVDVGGRRIAILGETGAGKTTLGRELLCRGGRLVADDLLALDGEARAHGGPPFVRVVDPVDGVDLDVGGKHRCPVQAEAVEARPVDRFIVLDPEASEPAELDPVAAIDRLLARPYSPAAAMAEELLLRLDIVQLAVGDARTMALPPKWGTPVAMADEVLGMR